MNKASDYLKPERLNKRGGDEVSRRDVGQNRLQTKIAKRNLEEKGYEYKRPETRAECPPFRPCPFVGCRYHLYLDITPVGNIFFNFKDIDPWQLQTSCALDLSDDSEGMSLHEVGERMGLTREQIRQIQRSAFDKMTRKYSNLVELIRSQNESTV